MAVRNPGLSLGDVPAPQAGDERMRGQAPQDHAESRVKIPDQRTTKDPSGSEEDACSGISDIEVAQPRSRGEHLEEVP